jgi:hypothetical protein
LEAIIAGGFNTVQALAPAVLLLYATILFMLAADLFATKDIEFVEIEKRKVCNVGTVNGRRMLSVAFAAGRSAKPMPKKCPILSTPIAPARMSTRRLWLMGPSTAASAGPKEDPVTLEKME